jgi:hypothetical protein
LYRYSFSLPLEYQVNVLPGVFHKQQNIQTQYYHK